MRDLFCEAKRYSCIVDGKAIVDIAFVYYFVVLSSSFVSLRPHGPCKEQHAKKALWDNAGTYSERSKRREAIRTTEGGFRHVLFRFSDHLDSPTSPKKKRPLPKIFGELVTPAPKMSFDPPPDLGAPFCMYALDKDKKGHMNYHCHFDMVAQYVRQPSGFHPLSHENFF
uniref:Uncharacterized protein n=1 Tax=Romanomermis culicivorax TaxID=13658 RepID=A0A915HPB2_ROMCU